MKNTVKERIEEQKQETQVKEQCHHFWAIEVANGPTSTGTCKYCGEKKEFLNAFPTINPLRRSSNPMTLPEIPDVEIDEESQS